MLRISGPSRLRQFARRLKHEQGGATAVEFGILALPFIMLIGGVIELGLVFMGQITLDNAMAQTSRQIRTGQLISSPNAATQVVQLAAFRDSVCDNMSWMVADCKANLSVDVRTYSAYSAIALSSPITNGVFNPGALTYNTGVPGSIVVVRGYYNWKLYMPVLNQALERTPGKTLLTSVTTFSVEPY
jgi:Flp pilus assembly protein TadG